MARRRRARPKPYGALAGVILVALAAGVLVTVLAVTWFDVGGVMDAPIDLGGRWGRGTLGGAVAGLGTGIAVMLISEVFLVRSLVSRWKRSSGGAG